MAAPEELISFSFRYLDTTKPKFAIKGATAHQFCLLAERMQQIGQLNRTQFIALQQSGKAWRVHRIDWKKVSEPSFGLHASLGADENAWQFALQKGHGRVVGFLAGTKFFVRWIDLNHQLYPSD